MTTDADIAALTERVDALQKELDGVRVRVHAVANACTRLEAQQGEHVDIPKELRDVQIALKALETRVYMAGVFVVAAGPVVTAALNRLLRP